MKCVVPGANVKVLAKAIHSLAKIGDEMYIKPQDAGISFQTVNMARSAYASFTFSESYFSYYTYGNLEQDDALRCQVTMRSAMAVFKAPGTLDRQVETCQINLEANSCKLVFVLKYRNGITKTHFLPIIDCQILQAAFSSQSSPNQLTAQHKVLSDAMQNFQQLGLIEITLEVTPQKVLLRNYVDDTSDLSKVTRTQLALGVGEFEEHKIGKDTAITFCVKEFKALLSFAEAVSLPVSIHFEAAGKPVIFIMKSLTFESSIVLSTLNPEGDNRSEASTIRSREQTMLKKAAASKRIPRKTNASANRKLRNQPKNVRARYNTSAFSPMEVTNMKAKKNYEAHHEDLMNTDSNEDCLLSTVGNKSVSSDIAYETKVCLSTPAIIENRSRIPTDSMPVSNSKSYAESIFSTIINDAARSETNSAETVNEDLVPNSPPKPSSKKAKTIFKKCFQTTFDPRMLPGHDIVLAEDTDDSD
ncbi:cell cycle checkpoint control protein RAD9A [Neodiprion lecontei]|uniref:Cell cycle checkpoint control protein RAD9A n=1 Tax=Neodiprion lecontei TaxID=441921 RepID=A0A6J0BKS3_NEOLC|nr:cell cycle checkpoint control protein RAD9A [Neodiprion lecontei]